MFFAGLTGGARRRPGWNRPGGEERTPEGRSQEETRGAARSGDLVLTIFGITYLAMAVGKVPGLRVDRAGIALVGAVVMLACGVLSLPDAAEAVDDETIVLLFGMRIRRRSFDRSRGSGRPPWKPLES